MNFIMKTSLGTKAFIIVCVHPTIYGALVIVHCTILVFIYQLLGYIEINLMVVYLCIRVAYYICYNFKVFFTS